MPFHFKDIHLINNSQDVTSVGEKQRIFLFGFEKKHSFTNWRHTSAIINKVYMEPAYLQKHCQKYCIMYTMAV